MSSQELKFNNESDHNVVLLFPQLLSDPIKYYAHSSIIVSSLYFLEKLTQQSSTNNSNITSNNNNNITTNHDDEKKEEHSDAMIITSDENQSKTIQVDLKVYNREAFEYVMLYLYEAEERDHLLDHSLDNVIDAIRLSILMGIPKLTNFLLDKLVDGDYVQHFFKLYYLAKTFAIPEMETRLKTKFTSSWKLSMYINYFDESMMLGFIEEYQDQKVVFGEMKLLEFALYWMKNNISDSNVAKLREILIPLSVKLSASLIKTKHNIALKTLSEFGADSSKLSDEMFLFMYNSLVSSIDLL
ncbi:predicted protein [Naegleria gruberi]|uniref:Predicted protein n=1 Tax=Naegleria gruberi TaxID=5762 RepID=D2VVV8_NAEGR|nr:uncharacterized protein NAEGRDRAFT_73157 [Naegleria gruberi]EFC39171.1 predicted protein [Naegleria gruberi]|eukprot:XP_002671915.1 predicted protein [Naegleria gruberi strain NEG-M]